MRLFARSPLLVEFVDHTLDGGLTLWDGLVTISVPGDRLTRFNVVQP